MPYVRAGGSESTTLNPERSTGGYRSSVTAKEPITTQPIVQGYKPAGTPALPISNPCLEVPIYAPAGKQVVIGSDRCPISTGSQPTLRGIDISMLSIDESMIVDNSKISVGSQPSSSYTRSGSGHYGENSNVSERNSQNNQYGISTSAQDIEDRRDSWSDPETDFDEDWDEDWDEEPEETSDTDGGEPEFIDGVPGYASGRMSNHPVSVVPEKPGMVGSLVQGFFGALFG